jgi:hypothetical protein
MKLVKVHVTSGVAYLAIRPPLFSRQYFKKVAKYVTPLVTWTFTNFILILYHVLGLKVDKTTTRTYRQTTAKKSPNIRSNYIHTMDPL